MPRLWKRTLVALLLLATACETLPLPRIVFDTPTPTAPPGPTPTPLPAVNVNFTVHIPASTPPNSAPAVRLIDEVSGRHITIILTPTGANVWSGSTPAAVGAVLRYKYLRPQSGVEEVTAARQPVPYRLFAVTQTEPAAIEDTVAAWADTPFAGDLGNLAGTVRNSNTGQGVRGVIVAAGGKVTLTAWDGSYTFFDLPTGLQRVTLLAPDGSVRPAQSLTSLGKGQTAVVDLASPDPNALHVTFVVRPPANTDPSAILRMAGNVSQLGDTFVLDPSGSSIAPGREPILTPLGDGRWAGYILLYEGTHLRYSYTLGDGAWNAELDSDGDKRVRQLIVPLGDTLIEDTVASWRTGTAASVTFDVNTPAMPANDIVTIQFRPPSGGWRAPLPMWPAGQNAWRYVLYNPTGMTGSVAYRYCRNYACGAADDNQTAGSSANGYTFTPTLFPQDLQSRVEGWRWLAQAAPPTLALPPINFHPGFAAGVDLDDNWQPNALPAYPETFNLIRNTGAEWVTFTWRGAALQMNPVPAYVDDPALAPLFSDWKTMVDQAHDRGLRVALHPVTCHYTPYGVCDYWANAPYNPGFWDAWFAAYERHILTQADIAARTGTDLLVIGDFKLRPSLPGEVEAAPDADARWRRLIGIVRARYRGQIAFEFLMGPSVWPNTPPFLDSVDVIRFFWWSALSNNSAPTVNDMAATAGGLMDAHLLPIQQRFGKPIHISAAYYSANGAATQCLRRDDGQCYSFEDFNPDHADPARYALDLYEQADIFNAMLTAVNARGWITGFSAYGYNPAVTLRDKSISVRGKPAEAVLAAWYAKLSGR